MIVPLNNISMSFLYQKQMFNHFASYRCMCVFVCNARVITYTNTLIFLLWIILNLKWYLQLNTFPFLFPQVVVIEWFERWWNVCRRWYLFRFAALKYKKLTNFINSKNSNKLLYYCALKTPLHLHSQKNH